jgi:hypothetical protein
MYTNKLNPATHCIQKENLNTNLDNFLTAVVFHEVNILFAPKPSNVKTSELQIQIMQTRVSY